MTDTVKDGTIPIPDPTKLTTDAVAAAKADLERLFDVKMAGARELIDEKFTGVNLQFQMRDTALSAAFKAAEAAVQQQNASNTLAIDKAGDGFTKQIDSLDEKIDDLKARVSLMEGHTKGTVDGWGYIVGGAGVLIAVIAIIGFVLKTTGH